MIFQSLIALYDRLARTNDAPPYGFSIEDIGFVVTLDKAGNMMGQPEDLRTKITAQKFEFRTSKVPYTNQVNVRSRAAATTPNFMVDKADYIFGMSGSAQKKVYHQSFAERIQEVCGSSMDEGIVAVKAFLERWNPAGSVDLEGWTEICGTHGKWVVFRLSGDSGFVHERPAVKALWIDFVGNEKQKKLSKGVCMVDGCEHYLQKQYAQFSFGTGASLSSCKDNYSWSYGKEKGENAPISVEAEFKSSTALKFLLRSKTQRLRIDDAVTVFWAEKESPIESFMGHVLNPSIESKADAVPVRKFLEAVRKGKLPSEIDGEIKFYILGFSVNKARLALRFWYVCTVDELMKRLHDHFQCLEMEQSEKDIPFPSMGHLLRETVFGKTPLDKDKNVSPLLRGALMRSILTGANYPQNLYQGVLGRIRADRRISYLRASILKAVLQRNHNKEVPMSLDTERREIAYLLGRLFAVLEKVQKEAIPGAKSTIRDRFISAAASTPATVFPRLLDLAQHHIKKAEFGDLSDNRIAEIKEHITDYPVYMNLQERGLFYIAYYQQKNAIQREIQEAIRRKQNQEKGEEA